jgi:hypothetical protein
VAKKAKKLTKRGRRRTGTTVGSGKRRGMVRAGARKSAKGTAGRRVKRAGRCGVSKTAVLSARRTRPIERKNVRRRASSVAKPEDAGGPSLPLRDLIRGGIPRSPRAHRWPGLVPGPWERSRTRSAHGIPLSDSLIQPVRARDVLNLKRSRLITR